jgi:hypothetical protein
LEGLGGIVVCVALGFGVLVVIRLRADKGEERSFQAEAKRSRSNALNRLLAVTSQQKLDELEALILAAKAQLTESESDELEELHKKLIAQGKDAIDAFSRFDDPNKDDPNVSGLAPQVYQHNQQSYEDIIGNFIQPAEKTLARIDTLLGRANQSHAA